MIRIACPNCQKKLKFPPEMVGKRVKCPKCEMKLAVPKQELVPVEPTSPATTTESEEPAKSPTADDSGGVLIASAQGHQQVEQRIKQHGLVRMILGGSLLLIALISMFAAVWYPWSLLASVLCLVQGGLELFWGINAYVSYILPDDYPAGIHRDLGGGDDALDVLLKKRLVTGTYMRPAGLLNKVALAFVPKFRFLTPAQTPLFDTTGYLCAACVGGFVVIIGVTLFVRFFAILVLAEMVLLGATAVAVLALRECVPGERNPKEDVIEEPPEKRAVVTGNAVDLVNHLTQSVFVSIREQERFNRTLWPAPKLESGKDFDVVFGEETEPLLIEESTTVPLAVPMLLERAGAGFVAGGWLAMFFLPTSVPFIASVAALPAITAGWRFLSLAFKLRNTFRFTSDVFRLELHGTSTAQQASTEILGVGGTAQRELLHTSNVYWYLHAARVVTESSMAARWALRPDNPSEGVEQALRSPRYIIRVARQPKLQQRVDTIVSELANYQDPRGRRDEDASDKAQAQAEQKARLEQQLKQQSIVLEQKLQLEGQREIEEIKQRGRLQEKLMERMIENMSPEEIQALAKKGDLPRITAKDPQSAKDPTSSLLELLRVYHTKSNPAEDRLAAKDEFDQLVKDFGVEAGRVDELTRLVLDELE